MRDKITQQGYLFTTIALALPVWLWPLTLLLGFQPKMGVSIEQNWAVAAACLLLITTTMDLLLAYEGKRSQLLAALFWIITIPYTINIIIQHLAWIWWLAAFFSLRALTLTPRLWQHHPIGDSILWWHWLAWYRDSSTAFIMFAWLYAWPQ